MRIIGFLLLFISSPVFAESCPERFNSLLEHSFSGPQKQDEGQVLVEKIRTQTLKETAEHHLPFKELIHSVDEIALRDPTFKKINEMFEKKQFTFAVDQNSKNRLDILKNGILNQHETATSAGVVSPEKRNFVESLYLRMDEATYEKMPAEIKPKSMYLVPELESNIKLVPTHYSVNPFSHKRVGDTWILDLKQIEKNTVFVVGDSLDRALIEGDLLDDPKWFTLNHSATLSGAQGVDHLLPLEWIKTSTPFYYEQVKSQNKLRFVDPKVFEAHYNKIKEEEGIVPMWQEVMMNTSQPKFEKNFMKKFPELSKYDDKVFMRPYGNYVEGLYFGKLPPKKIKAMIFHETPPTPEEMKEFERLGIQVIDGRGKY
jgi:hypothetical protein